MKRPPTLPDADFFLAIESKLWKAGWHDAAARFGARWRFRRLMLANDMGGLLG